MTKTDSGLRTQRRRTVVASGIVVIFATASTAVAELEMILDQAEWESAVGGNFETIDFTGFPDLTPITHQYADLGVHFTSFAVISGPSNAYPNDQWGIHGFNELFIEFDMDVQWVAIDFPGFVQIEIWRNGQFVEASAGFGSGGHGFFGGIISDAPFDAVRIWSPAGGGVSLDDFHFGPPIPGPGVLAVLGIAAVGRRRRRCAR